MVETLFYITLFILPLSLGNIVQRETPFMWVKESEVNVTIHCRLYHQAHCSTRVTPMAPAPGQQLQTNIPVDPESRLTPADPGFKPAP